MEQSFHNAKISIFGITIFQAIDIHIHLNALAEVLKKRGQMDLVTILRRASVDIQETDLHFIYINNIQITKSQCPEFLAGQYTANPGQIHIIVSRV